MKRVKKPDVFLPNLSQYLTFCTIIYLKMHALLPERYNNCEIFCWSATPVANLKIYIEERHKYTDCLALKIFWLTSTQWLTDLVIRLRMYHDMQIAEVIGYETENQVIHFQHRDHESPDNYLLEKKQFHRLLSEFLSMHFQ